MKKKQQTGWSMMPFENFTIAEKIQLCERIKNGEKNEKGYLEVEKNGASSYVQVSDEQCSLYKDYIGCADEYRYTKMDRIMDVLASNAGSTITYRDKILPLINRCAIYLYTDLTPDQKKIYMKKQGYDKDVNNFRGCCMGYRHCLMQYPKYYALDNELIEIFIHDQNETVESAAWILMHELGHAMVTEDYWNGFGELIRSMRWQHHGHLKKNNIDQVQYYRTDEGHEADPEEQFCNMIANTWLNKKMDRVWWREHLSPRKEE